MRRLLALLLSLTVLSVIGLAAPAPGVAKSRQPKSATEAADPGVRVLGAPTASEDVKSILAVVADLMKASNGHNLEGVLKHYSPDFVSGDNLTLEEIRHLVEETWKLYPDIRYETQTLEIRVNGDWATVESLDRAAATVTSLEGVIADSGTLESRSRGMIYLRRIGKSWEITSDYTLYENALILYGEAQSLKMSLSAPDLVFAGEPYTARINADLPVGMTAIASIAKDPLVYPQRTPADKFRSLSNQTNNELERVFDANTTNNNEIVTATIGLTQIGQDAEDRPTVKFKGIATVVKRVNVLSKSAKSAENDPEQMVRVSANGLIDLRKNLLQQQKEPPSAASE